MTPKHYVSRYTEESMDPQLSGVAPWPFYEEVKTGFPQCLSMILGANVSATHVRWFMDGDGKRYQARYFLKHSQGGALTGEAYCLYSYFHQGASKIRYIRVMMCDHTPESHSTRDERMRGWWKAHCTKCGLDMSVDSSG